MKPESGQSLEKTQVSWAKHGNNKSTPGSLSNFNPKPWIQILGQDLWGQALEPEVCPWSSSSFSPHQKTASSMTGQRVGLKIRSNIPVCYFSDFNPKPLILKSYFSYFSYFRFEGPSKKGQSRPFEGMSSFFPQKGQIWDLSQSGNGMEVSILTPVVFDPYIFSVVLYL